MAAAAAAAAVVSLRDSGRRCCCCGDGGSRAVGTVRRATWRMTRQGRSRFAPTRTMRVEKEKKRQIVSVGKREGEKEGELRGDDDTETGAIRDVVQAAQGGALSARTPLISKREWCKNICIYHHGHTSTPTTTDTHTHTPSKCLFPAVHTALP